MCDCVDIDNEISNVSYSEWCGQFYFLFFVKRWFTIASVTIVHYIFVFSVIFKVGVVICNQINVSNNKRRMVPLGLFLPRKHTKRVRKFVGSMLLLFTDYIEIIHFMFCPCWWA